MKKESYMDIPLSEISTNPENPRASFSGPGSVELVESINQKGVIEPIIVRPKKTDGKNYEVVAGERRFRAACFIAKNTGLLTSKRMDQFLIPSIVRDLSDDEAFEFMIIENLHREDLTPFEEAQSFKRYFEKKGKGSIPELARKIAKTPGYIRRQIAVLSLPAYTLKEWEKGDLTFSHLEQLRRLKNPGELKEAFEFATGKNYYRGDKPSKRELKEHIDDMAPPLKSALFDLEKEGCNKCPQNSSVQTKFWEIEGMKGAHCLDKSCFKKKQNNFLQANWKKTALHEKYKTNGFRFEENVKHDDHETFRDYGLKPIKKCHSCPNFLTIINSLGEQSRGYGQFCFDTSCYESREEAIEEKRRKRDKETKVELDEPRVTWHGGHFREKFWQERIPQVFPEKFSISGDKTTLALSVLSIFLLDDGIQDDIIEVLEIKDEDGDTTYMSNEDLFKYIQNLDEARLASLFKHAVLTVILGDYSEQVQRAVAEFIGIDLQKEWAVNQEYLEKKTIKEMLEFGESSGIFKNKKVQDYLVKTLKKKPGKYPSCKKTELIDLFLKSGVNLVGKVPEEILNK